MQELTERPVLTPLGPGICFGVLIEGDKVEWLVALDRTGEPFFFRNEDIRFIATVTNRRPDVSPFGEPSGKLARQIERYRKNGWLPT